MAEEAEGDGVAADAVVERCHLLTRYGERLRWDVRGARAKLSRKSLCKNGVRSADERREDVRSSLFGDRQPGL